MSAHAADDLRERIEAFIRKAADDASARVDGLRRLTGGASRETWSLDATIHGKPAPLIMQRDTRGAPKAMTRALEFNLLRASRDKGVPAPEPLWLGDETLGGESMFVRRIDGETLPRRLLREDSYAATRALLTPQLGAALAAIHRVDVEAKELAGLPAPADPASPAASELERYEGIFRMIAPEPHPAFELAFRWLRTHAPAGTGELALVHGDYRMGNMLFGAEGLRAVLDWELAHAGDPMEDLAWMCVRSWRFGGEKPVGGIGEREEFYVAYEEAGGRPVDRERVRFWEVFGNLRWGIICISQARTFLDGVSDSVELASIGRRTAETEWELLELVG